MDQLERRVQTLEAATRKRSALGNAVRATIDKWPGPFTARLLCEALRQYHPEALPARDTYQVQRLLQRLERSGWLTRTSQGRGAHASVYERTAMQAPPRLGRRRAYESGFRALVRRALDELPKEFGLAELKAWVAAHAPQVRIPEGSWSSQLWKMEQAGELAVAHPAGRLDRKLYTRGRVRIGPNGQERTELETAWSEFREQMEREKKQPTEDNQRNEDTNYANR